MTTYIMFWLYDFGIVFRIVVNCGKPEPLGNGTITYKDTTYESFSLSSCLRGFNLIGCPLRLCLSNGSWSGEDPFCQSKYFPKILHLYTCAYEIQYV